MHAEVHDGGAQRAVPSKGGCRAPGKRSLTVTKHPVRALGGGGSGEGWGSLATARRAPRGTRPLPPPCAPAGRPCPQRAG